MEFTVTRANNSTYKLPSSGSKIVSASQSRTLMGEDIVSMNVESVGYIDFKIGDWITVYGYKYTLNSLGEPERIGENTFSYNLEFEGLSYELTKVMFRSADFTGFNPSSEFSLTGTLEKFLDVLNYNLERKYGVGVWAVGSFPATEAKTLSFNSENCLLVLNTLCTEFGVEYKITNVSGVNTISLGEFSNVLPIQLEYGKGKGLYSLVRTNVDSKNIITRLYAEGADKNIKVGYRDNALRLRMGVNPESYIDSPSISSFGIIEGAKIFDDVFPHREGTISAIDATDKTKFVDSSMNFDLAETDTNGTKWLLPGASAKIHFNSGNLAGYAFDLVDYKHATKTFRIKPFKDDRGLEFPNDSAAFQFKAGDKYVILNIIMPPAYITTAESELLSKAQEYLSQNDQPRVEYNLTLDRFFLQRTFSGGGFQTNVIEVGDYLHLKDSKIGVDKNVRVKSFIRDGNDPWSYEVSLSDVIEPTRIERLIADSLDTKKAARQTKMFDPARSRRNWRDIVEVTEMIDTLKAEVALIGSPEGQFQLDSFFELNKNGNPDLFGATAGALAHDAYEGTAGSIWNIGAFEATLTQNSPYYLYAKCSKTTTGGVFTVSLTKIEVDSDPAYYHFPVGLISSKRDNSRTLTTTYGYTLISGNNISTGIIKNENSGIMINLETGDIQGKFKFTSGQSVEDAIVDQQIYVEYSVNGSTNWHTTFAAGDLYMRQKKGAGNWSSAIRLVGIDGTSGTDGRSVSGMTTEFYLSTSKTSRTGGSWMPNPPDWEVGKYLWTRVVITYANPTSTAYTTPVVSSEWEAINSIQIGGRNLVENTNQGMTNLAIDSSAGGGTWTASEEIVDGVRCAKGTKAVSTAETYAHFRLVIYTPWKFRANQQYAISFKMKLSFAVGNRTIRFSTATNQGLSPYSDAYSLVAGEWNHVKLVVTTLPDFDTILAGGTTVHLRVDIVGNSSTGDTVLLKDIMIEEGNKASAYAQAPEDVQAGIAAAKQEALTAAGNAQSTANSANTAVGNLSGYVDGAFKDGVVDTAEAKAIEKYKNSLAETKLSVDGAYTQLYNSTYLEGSAKSNLSSAKGALNSAYTSLVTSIDNAIADGKTTAAEKTDVDSKFGLFNTAMATYQVRAEEAKAAINVKLDTISKGYVDAIEIGGVNLLKDTNRETAVPYNNASKQTEYVNAERGKQYALSFDIKATGNYQGNTLLIQYYDANDTRLSFEWITGSVTTQYQRLSKIITMPTDPAFVKVSIGYRSTTPAGQANTFKCLQLEKGNKVSAYKPSPEDVPSALDYLATAIQDGSTDIEGGLVSTNVLKVKDTSGAVTGGMSGLSNDNVGFWTGGSYQDALGTEPIAKVVFRKDGSGQLAGGVIKFTEEGNLKVGDVDIDGSGALLIKEGTEDRVILTKSNVSTLADIAATAQNSTATVLARLDSGVGENTTLLNNAIVVEHNNTKLTVAANLYISISRLQEGAGNGYAGIVLKLKQITGGVGEVLVASHGELTENTVQNMYPVNKSFIVPAGTYKLEFSSTRSIGNPNVPFSLECRCLGGTLTAVFDGAKRVTEIGKNGIGVIADANNYSFFGVENGVYKIVEKTTGVYDRPGVLLAGRMEAGAVSKYWGAKHRAGSYREGNNIYRIHHNIGHVDYSVQLTPQLDARMWVIQRATTYCRVQASAATLDFDFAMFGDNK